MRSRLRAELTGPSAGDARQVRRQGEVLDDAHGDGLELRGHHGGAPAAGADTPEQVQDAGVDGVLVPAARRVALAVEADRLVDGLLGGAGQPRVEHLAERRPDGAGEIDVRRLAPEGGQRVAEASLDSHARIGQRSVEIEQDRRHPPDRSPPD